MTRVRPRINHVALLTADLERSVSFYREVLGYEESLERCHNMPMNGTQASLRAAGSDNHHDLAVTDLGDERFAAIRARVGATLSHFALEVDSIEDLAEVRAALERTGRLDGEFDTGATFSVFGTDPDGNRFEVLWFRPREEWGAAAHRGEARPLDLAAELSARRR
jgi:catechol-2,3-dioxygenase